MALSIVQVRLVGLAHFSVGYIFTSYAAFLIASTMSGKFDSICIMDTNRNSTIMARKSLIREGRRRGKNWKAKVPPVEDKWEIYGKLQSLPRIVHHTPLLTLFLTEGRELTIDFGLSGHILREMVHACLLA
ncbi:hypothetical protein H5410_052512 [Solanum commersonii]|uniref:Uncharacterized protein n=1 Tax=Solanum commersonii TaxID=4109 RepID=A0A9J5X385_SOLCO|nr:hypothetical protein H5410_052512 [Solanum commersonii]